MHEIERYELNAGPVYQFEAAPAGAARRDFLKTLGGGILILIAAPAVEAQESGVRGRRRRPEAPTAVEAWLHVGQDDRVTVFTGKVEVGQNSRTALTQAVSEELRAPVEMLDLVMGDTALTPYDMGTFGSRTTPDMAPKLRHAASAARLALIDLAAARWNAAAATLEASGGRVRNPATGASLSYGELTRGQALTKTVDGEQVHRPLGESVAKVHARAIVTGAHRYASDMVRPGMLYGKVLRPPAYGAALESVDGIDAVNSSGVCAVRDGNFAGVAAANTAEAERAMARLTPKWTAAPAQPSSAELFAYLKANPDGEPHVESDSGSVEEAWRSSPHKLASVYTVAYIAHTPLEPRAAVAEWNGGKLTVWTGTQVPFGVRSSLAEAFSLAEDSVRVIVPDTGSGYGGKHTGECAIEAARLARAAGKPVKVVWTREEEFRWAYFRPAGVMEVRSAADASGKLTAWEFHNYNSGPSGIATPYEAANLKVAFHPARSPLRQGSYRGLAATANHFARESHMDELAAAAGLDPLEFRLRNLKNERVRAVLEAAAERFGWRRAKAPAGSGYGLACGTEKGGYVASCAEVSVDGRGKVKIHRVAAAFECGAIVNPDHLKNQVEGAIIMGIGGALYEAIEFEHGRVSNAALSRYRVPRITDVPKLETVLVNRRDLDSAGAGETPIVALAPAVANAIFAACGRRVRSMPMAPGGTLRAESEG